MKVIALMRIRKNRTGKVKKRGQALVEFIIILPVAVMLVLMIVDFGRIMYFKTTLESTVSDAIILYNKGNNLDEIKEKLDNQDIEISSNKLSAKKSIDIVAPGLNLLFDNPYTIVASRVLNYDE